MSGVSVDSEFRSLIAPDTKVLANINFDKIKTTPLYQRHANSLDFPLLDASSERVGIDPRRDIADVLIDWNGQQGLIMAHGRFTPKSIEQKLTGLGMQRTTYRDYSLLGDSRNSLVFLNNALAIGGPMPVLRAAIDLKQSGGGQVPEELQQRLHSVSKGDQIWLVSRGGLPFTEVPMRSDYKSGLANIAGYVKETSMGVRIDTGVHLEADLSCVSELGAQRVEDGVRAGIAIGRLTARDDQQDLLAMYDAIHVDRAKDIVHLRGEWNADLVEKLLAHLPQWRSGAFHALKNRE